MKSHFLFTIALVLSFSCDYHRSISVTEDDIVNNYLESIGGKENLHHIETLIKKGHYIEPAYNLVLSSQVIKKRPNYRVIGDVDINGFEEGFNGKAWEYHKGKGLTWSQGEAEEAILIGADFDHPFIDANEKGNTISFKGMKVLGAERVYELEVIIPMKNDKYITSFFFDTDAGILRAQSKTMPIHAKGEDVNILVYFSDYRRVSGVLMPFSQIEREVQSGKFLNATIWSEIAANRPIGLEEFDPPVAKSDSLPLPDSI